MKKVVILFLASLALTACQTPYQSTGYRGGYSDVSVRPDIFRVRFNGNAYTSSERAQEFALLRAAEITLQRGFTCFTLVGEDHSGSVSTFTTPGRMNTTATGTSSENGNLYWSPRNAVYSGSADLRVNATTTYTPPQVYSMFKPSTTLLVRAFREPPNGVDTMDAAFIQRTIKEKYRLK